ncbi:uncharacterized protein LOC120675019 [Panicum virgatum]|uniref:uncharacterized protein LOC120675019 n=1 Tax=Panicum virgatum TaxID=38727 RepID=UPI0019D51DA8|nr:uncharacterized protein LOC120675019 [Panicum virgatum]
MYNSVDGYFRGYIVKWKISLISDLSIPLGLSSLQLALTLQLAPPTTAVRVAGDQKLHGHLQCAKEHDCDEHPVVGAEQRPAAEEHGAGHPAKCEQQRRDGLGGLFDGRRTDELPESGGKRWGVLLREADRVILDGWRSQMKGWCEGFLEKVCDRPPAQDLL